MNIKKTFLLAVLTVSTLSGCIKREQTPDYDLIKKKRQVSARLANELGSINKRLGDLDKSALCSELADIVYIGEKLQAVQEVMIEQMSLIDDKRPFELTKADYELVVAGVDNCQTGITANVAHMTDELLAGFEKLKSLQRPSVDTMKAALDFIAFEKREYYKAYMACCHADMERIQIIAAQNNSDVLRKQAAEAVKVRAWLKDFPNPDFEVEQIQQLKAKLDELQGKSNKNSS